MLLCPDCNHYLARKDIPTDAGGAVEIDHCSFCGGAFFDRFEINRIPYQEAAKLAAYHPRPSKQPLTGSGNCPKCAVKLERLAGENVPSDVYVFQCLDCHGTWFSPKQLEKFKDAQQTKIDYFRKWRIPLPSLDSVFIQVLLLAFLAAGVFLSVSKIQQSQESRTKAYEALAQPPYVALSENKQKAEIVFATEEPAKTEIIFYYNKPFGAVTLPVSAIPDTFHRVALTDLQAGKEYFYKIRIITAEDSLTTEEFGFVIR